MGVCYGWMRKHVPSIVLAVVNCLNAVLAMEVDASGRWRLCSGRVVVVLSLVSLSLVCLAVEWSGVSCKSRPAQPSQGLVR